MQGFMLDDATGDVVIESNKIQMVHGKQLTMQKIQSVWLTKKGEWFFDLEEGIDRDLILGKKQVDAEMVRLVLQEGLSQVDENLTIDEITCNFDKDTRKLYVSCVVRDKKTSETIEIETTF